MSSTTQTKLVRKFMQLAAMFLAEKTKHQMTKLYYGGEIPEELREQFYPIVDSFLERNPVFKSNDVDSFEEIVMLWKDNVAIPCAEAVIKFKEKEGTK